MAFTTKFVGATSGLQHVAFNVDWSVGRVGSNNREDVMLVQALMRIFYYEMMGFNHEFDPPPGETAPIVVDGWYGKVTQRHIDHFQDQAITRGKDIARDGIFDPYRAPGQLSTIQKKQYAFDLLNNGCANICKEQGQPNYDNLPNRTDMPVQLRNALKTIKSTAAKYQQGGR